MTALSYLFFVISSSLSASLSRFVSHTVCYRLVRFAHGHVSPHSRRLVSLLSFVDSFTPYAVIARVSSSLLSRVTLRTRLYCRLVFVGAGSSKGQTMHHVVQASAFGCKLVTPHFLDGRKRADVLR